MNKPFSHNSCIEIINGRVHNLKEVTLRLPHHQLIVVTGVSGSGKSSLVFHLLYAEAYRRYMGILESSFVRNFVESLEKPDVDHVNGLQAVIGVGQEISSSRTQRSTVGTLTDIYAFLRLLYARIADAYSSTGQKMEQQSEETIEERVFHQYNEETVLFIAPLIIARKGNYKTLFSQLYKKGYQWVIVDGKKMRLTPYMQVDRYKTHDIYLIIDEVTISKNDRETIKTIIARTLNIGKGSFYIESAGIKTYFSRFFVDEQTGLSYPQPIPSTFSFNSSRGACTVCHGVGTIYEINKKILIPDPNKNILQGGIPLLGKYKYNTMFQNIENMLSKHGYSLQTPLQQIPLKTLYALLHGTKVYKGDTSVNLARFLLKKLHTYQGEEDEGIETKTCPSCQGTRLNPEALHFKINGKNIAEICQMELPILDAWMRDLPNHLTPTQKMIGEQVLTEIQKRLQLLLHMGLHYFTLDRSIATLSGGEIRRLRIATQIGTPDSHLVGIMYVLDEPSIGLHPSDNQKLIDALKQLRDLGNTVIVIEHDRDTMLAADYLVEIGPGAGEHGGEIVAQGKLEQFLTSNCPTVHYLKNIQKTPIPKRRKSKNNIILQGCTGHTLKNVDITFPLGTFIAVTGVSGSGKSSLIHGTLVPAVKKALKQSHSTPLPYKNIEGVTHINKVIEVTQKPIGRTQRSNVATYTQLFDLIRDLFTQLPQARIRGWKASHFSFNMTGGRCENCKGAGATTIVMDFLPNVRITCDVCQGLCYNRDTLEVQYKHKSIADILAMTVEKALVFFKAHPKIITKLQALSDVGLGYIRIGHPAPELSGGEAQRVKISVELTKKNTGKTLYILDEPTTGLHFQDVEKLKNILQQLVDKGSTVICIEHNIDLIKNADYIIDLGPQAGSEGGKIMAVGTPEELAQNPESPTGIFLQKEFEFMQK